MLLCLIGGGFRLALRTIKPTQQNAFQPKLRRMAAVAFCCSVRRSSPVGHLGMSGACSLMRWLRWVEVSPKRFSLPSLLTHSDRCTCPFGQMAKFAFLCFCSTGETGRPGHEATWECSEATRRRRPDGYSAEVGRAVCPRGFLL